MPAHKLEQWKHHMKRLEDLASDCFTIMLISATSKEANVPAKCGTDVIPSTSSGVINHSDVQISAKSTRSTLINDPTQVHSSTSVTNHSDVPSDTSDDEENVINTKERKINTGEDNMEVAEDLGIYDESL